MDTAAHGGQQVGGRGVCWARTWKHVDAGIIAANHELAVIQLDSLNSAVCKLLFADAGDIVYLCEWKV